MKDEYRRLLEAADKPNCYEFPAEFDYNSLEAAALHVSREIADTLGEPTKFEGAIFNQDASSSIALILGERQRSTAAGILQPVIRFSNFGRLASIAYPELLGEALTGEIVRIVESGGFHYIPADVLDAPYDGVMAGNPALPTWWIRYFDWL